MRLRLPRLPHPLVLLLGGVAVAAVLTWVVPAGFYERRTDPVTQRAVVIPGTYAPATPAPVGPGGALMAVPRGIISGADVILTILFVGGTFALLNATGALARLVGSLLRRTRRPRLIVILLVSCSRRLAPSRTCTRRSSRSSRCSSRYARDLGFGWR